PSAAVAHVVHGATVRPGGDGRKNVPEQEQTDSSGGDQRRQKRGGVMHGDAGEEQYAERGRVQRRADAEQPEGRAGDAPPQTAEAAALRLISGTDGQAHGLWNPPSG